VQFIVEPFMSRLSLFVIALSACGGGGSATPVEPACDEPTAVPCFDAALLDLGLQTTVSAGAVQNLQEDGLWVSDVDASAGGFLEAAQNPWTYVKFTSTGLEKVAIDDEASLESMDWDLGLHRFRIRLNSGSSGPGCVTAGVVRDVDFDAITRADLEFTPLFADDYYTESCDIINDSSGLPGSPQLAMSPWWSYPNCVATTKVPFLIQLQDGQLVRLVVSRYYQDDQASCNENSSPGENGGNIRMRWAFVDSQTEL
jgi:hypothetical protein